MLHVYADAARDLLGMYLCVLQQRSCECLPCTWHVRFSMAYVVQYMHRAQIHCGKNQLI
jgi:hypothetical protein